MTPRWLQLDAKFDPMMKSATNVVDERIHEKGAYFSGGAPQKVFKLLRDDLEELEDELIDLFENREDEDAVRIYTSILTEEEELFEKVASTLEEPQG